MVFAPVWKFDPVVHCEIERKDLEIPKASLPEQDFFVGSFDLAPFLNRGAYVTQSRLGIATDSSKQHRLGED